MMTVIRVARVHTQHHQQRGVLLLVRVPLVLGVIPSRSYCFHRLLQRNGQGSQYAGTSSLNAVGVIHMSMTKQGIANLYKAGFHKSLKAIFPVRKEAGENPEELKAHIRRKLMFDIGITSLNTIGNFDVQSAGVPEIFASGVAVLEISKHTQNLLWLRLGERCYDVEIKLGEDRRQGFEGEQFLGYKDCSHVTGEMIQQALPKFLGRISQALLSPKFSEGVVPRFPAICHEIRLQAFEHPMLKLHIRCGAGFRPKTFVYELASELGTLGYPTRLHRISQGPFTYEEALPSYAVSWENCKKVSEKYADRYRTYVYEMRSSHSEQDIKPFITEKRLSRVFRRRKKNTTENLSDEDASVESCENV